MRFKDFETFYAFWNFNAYKCTVNAWITPHDSVQSQLQKQSLYKIWVLCTGQLDCFFNTSWLEQSVIFYMMASSNGNIFCVTGHLYGEFPVNGEFTAQRPATRSFGVFFDLRLNKRLSKQSCGWWFETLSRPSWRHCNERRHFQMHILDKCVSYNWTEHWSSIKLIHWGQRALAHISITRPQLKKGLCICHELHFK